MNVKIYGTSTCPFCIAAKEWFENNNIKFEEIVLNNYSERLAFYKEMNASGKVKNNISTVPQIFIDGEHIGGYDDLRANANRILMK